MPSEKALTMDAYEIYHFLFETFPGIGVLVGIGLVVSLLAAVLMERRTRKTYVDRGERAEGDEWSFFDDDDEDDEENDTSAAQNGNASSAKETGRGSSTAAASGSTSASPITTPAKPIVKRRSVKRVKTTSASSPNDADSEPAGSTTPTDRSDSPS